MPQSPFPQKPPQREAHTLQLESSPHSPQLEKTCEAMKTQCSQKINKIKVFEIWKVFLEENEDDLNEIFVIISANAIVDGYKKINWEKIYYEGFYTTVEEAQNQITSYI